MDKTKISQRQKNKIRFAGIVKNKTLIGPQSIDILITSKCNINCLYCTIHSPFNTEKIRPGYIKWPLLKKIIDDARRINTDSITLSGDGEPWLHPQIEKIISYIKNKGLGLTINTNLTFPDPKILKIFIKADKLRVNAASLTEDLYCKIHSTDPNVYKNLIRNLTVIGKISKINSLPELIIVYIVTKLNYRNLPEMVSSLQKYKIKNIEIELMEEKEFTRKLSIGKNQIAEFKKIVGNLQNDNLETDFNFNFEGDYRNPCKECYLPYLNGRIETDGTVAFCCKNSNLILGNVHKNTLRELWFSDQAQEIRYLATHAFNLDDPLWKPCITCDQFSIMKNKAIYLKKKGIVNEE